MAYALSRGGRHSPIALLAAAPCCTHAFCALFLACRHGAVVSMGTWRHELTCLSSLADVYGTLFQLSSVYAGVLASRFIRGHRRV